MSIQKKIKIAVASVTLVASLIAPILFTIYTLVHASLSSADSMTSILYRDIHYHLNALIIIICVSILTDIGLNIVINKLMGRLVFPIVELASLANHIKSTGDYGLRSPGIYEHEVGQLEDALNSLLEEIQRRDLDLVDQQIGLEQQVYDRTIALTEAKLKAEQASEAKTLFLTSMSHELRTPLTAIRMYTELVRDALEKKPDLVDHLYDLDIVISSSDHLLSLIEDILDLARVEAGRTELLLLDHTAGSILDEVAGQAEILMDKNENTFETNYDSVSEIILYTDKKRVIQILINLLGNSAKFTSKGHISLFSRVVDNNIHFEVSDTGIGMTQEQLKRVWREFEQADKLISKKYGGTGLGLAITKKFTEILGGSVSAESTENVGSKFTVILPKRTRQNGKNTPR